MVEVVTGSDGVSRRRLAAGAAWAVPLVAVGAAVPVIAASCDVAVTIETQGLSGGGVDLHLRDTKATNSETNVLPSTTTVVNLVFLITVGGLPVEGVTVVVAGDDTKDSEGNFMIGFSPSTQTSGFGESPTKRTAAVVSDASGLARVKVSTATYNQADCGHIPRAGTFNVAVTTECGSSNQSFTYRIFDGLPLASCAP